MKTRIWLAMSLLACSSAGLSARGGAPGVASDPARPRHVAAAMPVHFERNQGQTDARVEFLSRTPNYAVFLTGDSLTLSLTGDRVQASSVRIAFTGANTEPRVEGVGEVESRSNYFNGSDRRKWHTSVPNYAKVRYQGLYPNVDLIVYGRDRELEYDFVVGPHTSPDVIRLTIEGGDTSFDNRGNLLITTPAGIVTLSRPHVYQDADDGRHVIAAEYRAIGSHAVGFTIGRYDTSRPLVIDPVLGYSTYLGGSNWDFASDLRVDAAGNAYVCGYTDSLNFPTTAGQIASGGWYDAFVAKIRPDGSLDYATYLGGTGFENGIALAVDPSGAVYVTGATTSSDFPVVAPIQYNTGGGLGGDAFLAKIDPTGSTLVYSTYLGGSGTENGTGIVVGSTGTVYLAGVTNSLDFPMIGAPQSQFGGGFLDGFVAKVNAAGTALESSTYLGGSGSDEPRGIAIGPAGEIYVTGSTYSQDFPVLSAIQPHFGGLSDGFVTKLNSTASAIIYSTYLGTNGWDGVGGAKVLADGSLLISGNAGFGFPTTAGAFQRNFGGYSIDAFVSRLTATGDRFIFSTYFGGDRDDGAGRIDTDPAGRIWVSGSTDSTNLPMVSPVQGTYGGGIGFQDAFVAEFSANGGQLLFSTFLGGSDIDSGLGLGVDASGNVYVGGQTASSDFPTEQPIQSTAAGPRDAFLARIVVNQIPTADAAQDQSVTADATCRAIVALDATGSSDPDGDQLTYTWTGSFGSVTGATPLVPLGTGTHDISLSVDDGNGGTSVDTMRVTVVDNTAPEIASLTVSLPVLNSPNHQMRNMSVVATTAPSCDATGTCQIVGVTSNEPDNGLGDGDSSPDWIITGPLTLQLRAERAGSGSGRIYTITVRCIDASGNGSTRTVTVTVP